MKIHIVTIGKPKLAYAQLGFADYLARLQRLHDVTVTHLADKYANESAAILQAAPGYRVALEINGQQLTSPQLADWLAARELAAQPVSFMIGGPDGLPPDVRAKANQQISLGKHTLPHDLAMLVLAEALFRAASIHKGLPYHR